MGGFVDVFVVDVKNCELVDVVIDKVVDEWGWLDIFINNVGIMCDILMLRMLDEEWDDVLIINLWGVFFFVWVVLWYMMCVCYGWIINIVSVLGIMGNFG